MPVRELAELVEKNGTEVRYAIHPVAGRMPGHMNVLLAEANVHYDQLCEMDAANRVMDSVDVCLVIGANDVVNPAAREDKGSPIYGMPIIEADRARTVLVLKRSMAPGFAGIGTQANNALGSATKLAGDANGNVTAVFGGTNYGAFLDSGSNANFFPSSVTVCPSPNDGFYCPTALTSESAKLQGTGGASVSADFNVDNANTLFSTNPTYTAFPDLAGPIPSSVKTPFFDLGLSFFFSRNVFTGFENPGANAAPFYAY